MSTNSYKGKIYFAKSKNPTEKLISFDVTEQTTFHFTDTLLCEFKSLRFSREEKTLLTHKDRETIKKYQSVNCDVINALSEKLIKAVSKKSCKKIYISASDFGVYICLAAIFSGKLPKNVQMVFTLENTPLAIFPKKLIKNLPSDNLHFEFNVSQDSWLSPFKSLYDHFPIKRADSILKTT